MMDQMSSRTGIPYRQRPCLDVLKMARDFVKKEDVENHKLQTVLQVMFPEKTFRFHQAIDDVRATALIMSKFIKQYLDYEESSCQDRHSCRLVYAYYCINPNQKSQVRIKLNLSEGEYGDIYWDVINKVWSCKKTSKAKRLFESVNIANLEKQVLSRYGWRYQALHTIVTKDRFALITVLGNSYVILDIFLRMLSPEELKLGQGFPEDYIIDHDITGKKISKTGQVARIGNSVVPIMAKELVLANCSYLKVGERIPNLHIVEEEYQLKFA